MNKIKTNRKKASTRQGFGDAIAMISKKNKKIVALCADLSESLKLQEFKKNFPSRYIEVGVAEQNLVTVASGLAAVGKVPFAGSFAAFCPGRCWEQIRTTICYNNQNVKIVGSHTGISVGEDGATHQMLEDIALMRVLPNMKVIVPMDYCQTFLATKAITKINGPCYLRLTRPKTKQISTMKSSFTIGKAQVLNQGKDVAIIGAGPILVESLEAAKMLAKEGINVMVINSHTIKPLDKKTIISAAKKCGKVITIEEAQINGGLGGAVSECLAKHYPVPIKMIGMEDKFGESGKDYELYDKFGLSAKHIVRKVKSFCKKSKK
jgi:transketolase